MLQLLNGQLDVVLALVLAVLATTAHLLATDFWPGVIDLLACAAAALTPRWPRVAGIALGIVLAVLVLVPPEWRSLGEYACLIPILGTGVRGQVRERRWMTTGYGLLVAAMTWRSQPWDPWLLVALGFWAATIGAFWGVGNLFTSYRNAIGEAHKAALQEQRLAVARDLHDIVARELSNASLQAQAALEEHPSPMLENSVRRIQQASTQLRWMLTLLRTPVPASSHERQEGTLSNAFSAAVQSLKTHGFDVHPTVDGDLDVVPAALTPTLRATFGEICANVERHGDPTDPCVIIVSVTPDLVDAVFMNTIRTVQSESPDPKLGLRGLKERLALVGGELAVEQEGSRWIARIRIAA